MAGEERIGQEKKEKKERRRKELREEKKTSPRKRRTKKDILPKVSFAGARHLHAGDCILGLVFIMCGH